MDQTQTVSKLSGSFQAEVGGGTLAGVVKGKVKPNWDVNMTLSRPGHLCSYNFKGKWTPHSTGNEIGGTYRSKNCNPSDFGMIDEFIAP